MARFYVTVIVGFIFLCGFQTKQEVKFGPPANENYDLRIIKAVEQTLISNAELLPDLKYWYVVSAISRNPELPYTYFVTVAALPENTSIQDWKFQDVIWTTTMTIDQRENGSGFTGTLEVERSFIPNLTTRGMEQPEAALGRTEYMTTATVNFFPWLKGTQAQFGVLGLHDFDFSSMLPSWKAIDFLGSSVEPGSTPNVWYAITGGAMSVLCDDGTQVALRIGDWAYNHFVPSNQFYNGRIVAVLEPLGAAVTGDTDTNCGYTDQAETSYHIHVGFPWQSWLQFERWVYYPNLDEFQAVGETPVEPGDWITAEWTDNEGTPMIDNLGNYRGESFWDWVVNGIGWLGDKAQSKLPQYGNWMNITKIVQAASVFVSAVYTIMWADMSFALTVFSATLVLELFKGGKGLIKAAIGLLKPI